MSWEQWYEAYLSEQREVNQNTTTEAIRGRWLRRFMATCRQLGVTEPNALREAHIDAFRNELLWQPCRTGQLYAQNSIDQALQSVRLWMKWAVSRGWLLLNPAAELVIPRRQALSRHIPMAEVERLLAVPDRSTPLGLRDAAVLETLYSIGLRRSECVGLDLDDVNFDARTIRVLGKGGWERLAPLGETLAATLDLYLRDARPQLAGTSNHPDVARALFLAKGGRRLAAESLTMLVERRAAQAGLEGVTTHSLRHAFACHMLDNGADFFAVQQLMGHAHPQSTETYTPVEHRVMAGTFRATHPRAGRRTAPGDVPTEFRLPCPPFATRPKGFDREARVRDNEGETSAAKEVKAS